MPDYTVNLGTTWQTFTTEFITKGFTGIVSNGRLMFWLAPFAAAGDNYYIDAIRLEKVIIPVSPGITTQQLASLWLWDRQQRSA